MTLPTTKELRELRADWKRILTRSGKPKFMNNRGITVWLTHNGNVMNTCYNDRTEKIAHNYIIDHDSDKLLSKRKVC